jgi:hypothetical protein
MATGILNSQNNADIVNYYIAMGVMGGLLLMLLFIGILLAAFAAVGKVMDAKRSFDQRFLAWALGCALFGHVVTFMSVSYFDQTLLFLYLLLASIGSLYAAHGALVPVATSETESSVSPIEEDLYRPC